MRVKERERDTETQRQRNHTRKRITREGGEERKETYTWERESTCVSKRQKGVNTKRKHRREGKGGTPRVRGGGCSPV